MFDTQDMEHFMCYKTCQTHTCLIIYQSTPLTDHLHIIDHRPGMDVQLWPATHNAPSRKHIIGLPGNWKPIMHNAPQLANTLLACPEIGNPQCTMHHSSQTDSSLPQNPASIYIHYGP